MENEELSKIMSECMFKILDITELPKEWFIIAKKTEKGEMYNLRFQREVVK